LHVSRIKPSFPRREEGRQEKREKEQQEEPKRLGVEQIPHSTRWVRMV